MAWKAKLIKMVEWSFPSDAMRITIEYRDEASGKTIEREYDMNAEQLQTLQQFRAFVVGELTKLNNRSAVVAVLQGQINTEIT